MTFWMISCWTNCAFAGVARPHESAKVVTVENRAGLIVCFKNTLAPKEKMWIAEWISPLKGLVPLGFHCCD